MTPEQEQAMWRNRFIMMNVVRIAATVGVLIGLLIWQTDMVREGGAPEIGLPMALIGLVASFGAPKYLARKWRTPDP
ncbi:hypothetical protein [Sphingosinicella sp. LY1275]|uniref:hypothetical protein n=1 Tax=Sphingosinicella sp. LY1275 TaxID=3095379 RepID=UPI002ADEA979|nr:hypothetical protein [Sphingosinicella sp. LY1275]MEA1014988.1 hypothetical protein [Sphingosinicella sp. LY1275]